MKPLLTSLWSKDNFPITYPFALICVCSKYAGSLPYPSCEHINSYIVHHLRHFSNNLGIPFESTEIYLSTILDIGVPRHRQIIGHQQRTILSNIKPLSTTIVEVKICAWTEAVMIRLTIPSYPISSHSTLHSVLAYMFFTSHHTHRRHVRNSIQYAHAPSNQYVHTHIYIYINYTADDTPRQEKQKQTYPTPQVIFWTKVVEASGTME